MINSIKRSEILDTDPFDPFSDIATNGCEAISPGYNFFFDNGVFDCFEIALTGSQIKSISEVCAAII